MLDYLLGLWQLNYVDFARFLGIHINTLWKYRRGERTPSFTWEQVQKLEQLLEKIDKKPSDLPSDWILDNSRIPASWLREGNDN